MGLMLEDYQGNSVDHLDTVFYRLCFRVRSRRIPRVRGSSRVTNGSLPTQRFIAPDDMIKSEFSET